MFKKNHATAFKDSKGRWLTLALFWEYRASSEENLALFCLKDEDHTDDTGREYTSLKKRYLSYSHVPGFEYDFAVSELGGWEHWERLQDNKYIRANIDEWRREYEIALRCKAVKTIIDNAGSKDKNSMASAKWLAEKGYIDKRPGRISKDELAREAALTNAAKNNLKDDMERLGLSVVNGGS